MEEGYQIEELKEIKGDDKRPQFLKVVSILSFISLGFAFLGNISQLISGPASKEDMLNQKVEMTKSITQLEQMDAEYWIESVRKLIAMSESLNNSFYAVTFLTFISALIGLFGVLKMWKGSKIGFHFYIIYSLISVGQVYLFVSPQVVPTFVVIWNILISGVFVFMYSRNLKWMK